MPSRSDQPETSSIDAIASELKAMLKTGVTPTICATAPALLCLELTKAKAATNNPEDLAVAACQIVTEAAASVDAVEHGATSVLLGTSRRWHNKLAKQRRAEAAMLLHISPEHLRKDRAPQLIHDVAQEIYARDAFWRRRTLQTDLDARARKSYDYRAGVDWLQQQKRYASIFMPITALGNDTAKLHEYLKELRTLGLTPYDIGEDHHPDLHFKICDRLATMTWRLAQYLQAMHNFMEEDGGLWILPNQEDEATVSKAIYQFELSLPFGDADKSWLRLLLKQAEHQELEPFTELLLKAGQRRVELMGGWVAWAWEN